MTVVCVNIPGSADGLPSADAGKEVADVPNGGLAGAGSCPRFQFSLEKARPSHPALPPRACVIPLTPTFTVHVR